MGNVLYDMHIADGYSNGIPGIDSSRKVAAAYYKGIYKKYGIDSALYNKSLKFYGDNPEVFSKVYEKLVKELSREKSRLIKADSLFNLQLAKQSRIKFKKDSIKIADSIAKTPAFKKEQLKKKADSVKKADSLKKLAVKRADSIKKAADLKKTALQRNPVLKNKIDSIKRRSILHRSRN